MIVITPAWVSYVPIIEMWKGKTVLLKTSPEDGYLPDEKSLEQIVSSRTKAILINSPNNPTGAVYSPKTLQMISNFAKKHDLYVVADEIYEKLSYDLPHISIASFDGMIDRTIIINGFSKSYAMTGWRVGYSASSQSIAKEISKIQSHTTSNVNSIAQKAALKALDVDTSYMAREFRERRDLTVGLLLKAGFNFFRPQGAFYVMIDMREFISKKSTEEFCLDLIKEAGVAMIPADDFYAPGFVRMSFSTSKDEIENGIQRMRSYLKTN